MTEPLVDGNEFVGMSVGGHDGPLELLVRDGAGNHWYDVFDLIQIRVVVKSYMYEGIDHVDGNVVVFLQIKV